MENCVIILNKNPETSVECRLNLSHGDREVTNGYNNKSVNLSYVTNTCTQTLLTLHWPQHNFYVNCHTQL